MAKLVLKYEAKGLTAKNSCIPLAMLNSDINTAKCFGNGLVSYPLIVSR